MNPGPCKGLFAVVAIAAAPPALANVITDWDDTGPDERWAYILRSLPFRTMPEIDRITALCANSCRSLLHSRSSRGLAETAL